MLESQVLRTLALGVTFAVAAIFVVCVTAIYFFRYGLAAVQVPMIVIPVVLGVAIYEFGMRYVIKRHVRRESSVPAWVWYANACIEITAMSTLMVIVQDVISNPIYALSTPPLVGYFLFIVLSTLYLDFRLSLFTGSLAAIQYLAFSLFTFSTFGSDTARDIVFLTPGLYVAKALIVFMAGAGAAFVARELLRRQLASLRAIEERDREQHANTMKPQFLADMSMSATKPATMLAQKPASYG
jgi:adenylate cyclase